METWRRCNRRSIRSAWSSVFHRGRVSSRSWRSQWTTRSSSAWPGGAGADFALGDPSRFVGQGALVGSMVTTVEEAAHVEAAGADFVIAQGAEAGGHRSTFDVSGDVPLVGTMALVPQVVDAVDVPVVATGGIVDGRGVAAALALGADGAQLGTRFLLAREAATAPGYRAALLHAVETDTVVTTSFTGRPARSIRNRFVGETAGVEPLPGPGSARPQATSTALHSSAARRTCTRCSPDRDSAASATASRRRRSWPRSPRRQRPSCAHSRRSPADDDRARRLPGGPRAGDHCAEPTSAGDDVLLRPTPARACAQLSARYRKQLDGVTDRARPRSQRTRRSLAFESRTCASPG